MSRSPRRAAEGRRVVYDPAYFRTLAAEYAATDRDERRRLRAICAGLRDALSARAADDRALEQTLDAWWPGGAENPGRGSAAALPAWIRCYGRYQFLAGQTTSGRAPTRAAGAGGADRADPAGYLDPDAAAGRWQRRRAFLEAALSDALADRPVPITLADGTRLQAYPKSYVALEELAALGHAMHLATVAADPATAAGIDAEDSAVARALGAAMRAPTLRALATRAWCWIVTHPEPGLPYPPDAQDPEPPGWTSTLAPQDLLVLLDAFGRANAHRLIAVRELASLLAPTDADDESGADANPLGFAGFLGEVAAARGLDVADVMGRWSLARTVAAQVSEAVAQARALARAKREHARESAAAERAS